MLGELTEEVAVNLRSGFRNINRQENFLCAHGERSLSEADRDETAK